jgi:hypothetical protein
LQSRPGSLRYGEPATNRRAGLRARLRPGRLSAPLVRLQPAASTRLSRLIWAFSARWPVIQSLAFAP